MPDKVPSCKDGELPLVLTVAEAGGGTSHWPHGGLQYRPLWKAPERPRWQDDPRPAGRDGRVFESLKRMREEFPPAFSFYQQA